MTDAPRPPRPWRKRLRHLVQQLGPARLAAAVLFLLLALLLARLSWQMPLIVDAERALYDMRATLMAPRVEQDRRIVMVTYTDETLFATGIRSPVDRAILTQALGVLDAMQPDAIGIDIVFDSPRPEDPALQAQLRKMTVPTWLAYAEQSSNPNTIQYQQQEFLRGYIDQTQSSLTRPASVRFATDQDGVIRRWPDRPTGLPPLLANAMISRTDATAQRFATYQGAVRFRLPLRADASSAEPVFAKIPIEIVAAAASDPDMAAALADQFRGRLVLIGGDIVDVDQFSTPLSRLPDLESGERKSMIGMEVHAQMLAQQLDKAALKPVPSLALWLLAALVVLAGALTALSDLRARWALLAIVVQLGFFVLLPFWLHGIGVDTGTLPTFGWALGWILGYATAGTASRTIGAHQRAFAQSALGKYLPRDIAAEILRDPERLALHGEKREIVCVFTDLEGFTALTHAVSPETVARLLNAYLDELSAIVLAHGGTIDKFVGDAVVAFWGAPISRDDDADRAVSAAIAMHAAGERFRKQERDGVPTIGMTRVGVHVGEAIVGNFGGEGRIQYTALGDSMNTASRLEAANKALHTGVLVSAEVVERTTRDDMIPFGRVTLRGRATPVDVFVPAEDLSADERQMVHLLVKQGVTDDTSLPENLVRIPAMQFLVERLSRTKEGESYDLS